MALSAEKAIESIHTMHVLIERIFSGVNDEDLALLINHFFLKILKWLTRQVKNLNLKK